VYVWQPARARQPAMASSRLQLGKQVRHTSSPLPSGFFCSVPRAVRAHIMLVSECHNQDHMHEATSDLERVAACVPGCLASAMLFTCPFNNPGKIYSPPLPTNMPFSSMP